MIRAVSGVYRLPPDCPCGVDATTLDLDGSPACSPCAEVLAADPVAQADTAARRLVEDELRRDRLGAAITAGEPPWWWSHHEDH